MARGSLDNSFWTQQFPRWAGAAAMLGGVLCVLAAFLHSMEPAGCVGLDCDLGALRSATGVVPLAAAASTVLLLVGVAGLAMLARRSGRHTGMATAGLICTAVGFVLLSAGGLIQSLAFGGNFPGMLYFVAPALLAIFVGLLLIGIAILRSNVLPRWLAVFFIVSSVALVAFNEQAVTVLLAIPFGLAMVAAGYFMWARGTVYASAPGRITGPGSPARG